MMASTDYDAKFYPGRNDGLRRSDTTVPLLHSCIFTWLYLLLNDCIYSFNLLHFCMFS